MILPQAIKQVLLWRTDARKSSPLLSEEEERVLSNEGDRLLKETGRFSNSPVFVVGIFSGADKLGEGFGSSLKMAEFRVRGLAVAVLVSMKYSFWAY